MGEGTVFNESQGEEEPLQFHWFGAAGGKESGYKWGELGDRAATVGKWFSNRVKEWETCHGQPKTEGFKEPALKKAENFSSMFRFLCTELAPQFSGCHLILNKLSAMIFKLHNQFCVYQWLGLVQRKTWMAKPQNQVRKKTDIHTFFLCLFTGLLRWHCSQTKAWLNHYDHLICTQWLEKCLIIPLTILIGSETRWDS